MLLALASLVVVVSAGPRDNPYGTFRKELDINQYSRRLLAGSGDNHQQQQQEDNKLQTILLEERDNLLAQMSGLVSSPNTNGHHLQDLYEMRNQLEQVEGELASFASHTQTVSSG